MERDEKKFKEPHLLKLEHKLTLEERFIALVEDAPFRIRPRNRRILVN